MPKEKIIYAKDFKCCIAGCKRKAVCFWPMVDPDIPHHPYCRKCKDDAVTRLMLEIHKIDQKYGKPI